METWQKVVLAILGAWIVYSIAIWVVLEYLKANYGKTIFGQTVDLATIMWFVKTFYGYTIMGVFGALASATSGVSGEASATSAVSGRTSATSSSGGAGGALPYSARVI